MADHVRGDRQVLRRLCTWAALVTLALMTSVTSTSTAQTVVGRINVDLRPLAVAITPDGATAYVLNFGEGGYSGTISVISTATNKVTDTITFPMAERASSLALTPDGKYLYVPMANNASVLVISTATNTVVRTIDLSTTGFGADGDTIAITFSPDGTLAFLAVFDPNDGPTGESCIYVVTTASDTITQVAILGAGTPAGMVIAPDGTTLYVSFIVTNVVAAIPLKLNNPSAPVDVSSHVGLIDLGANLAGALGISPDGSKLYIPYAAGVGVVDTASDSLVTTVGGIGGFPEGIAVAPNGRYAYVAAGSGTTAPGVLDVLDTATETITDVIHGVGIEPTGLAITPDGKYAYVPDSSFFSATGPGAVYVVSLLDATSTTARAAAAIYSPAAQSVSLTAQVSATGTTVNAGTVTFQLTDTAGHDIGTAVSAPVNPTGTATVSYPLPAGLTPGSYPIRADYADPTDTYQPSSDHTDALTLTPATPTTPTISNLPATATYGGNFTASVTTTGSGVHSVSSTTPAVCTVSHNELSVTFVGAGTCTLTAHVSVGTDYAAADGAAQTIQVTPATQKITFTSTPPTTPVPGDRYLIKASGGASGRPVLFATDQKTICTISGATVTFLAAGRCVISADQAGTADYTAAPQVQQVVTVTPAPTPAPTTSTPPTSTLPPSPTASAASTGLASTGTPLEPLLLTGLAAGLLGLTTMLTTRRRRTPRHR